MYLFFIYVIGLPLGILLMLLKRWNNKTLFKRKSHERFGILYENYSKPRFFWEFVVLLRRTVSCSR